MSTEPPPHGGRKRIKILHVVPSIARSYGGPTQSLAGYVAASRAVGIETHVAAPDAELAEVEALESAGASSVSTFSAFGSGGFVVSPTLVRWVTRNAPAFDVVHVHGLFNSISVFAGRAAIAAGTPVVVRPFGTLSRYTFRHRRGSLKRPWFNRLERPNLLAARGIHFTTTTERDEAEWHRLPLRAKSHVVPPPFLSSITEKPQANSRANDSVIFVGRLNRVKNLEALLDAWPLVKQARPAAALTIAGSGDQSYEAELHQRVNKLGLQSSVAFTGFLTAAGRDSALAKASLFVLPSHHENFGMVVLEAIAAGIPVVVSAAVQLADFIADNEFGVVTDTAPQTLARAIADALGNSELRGRARAKGNTVVCETFSKENIGEQLSNMYLAVLETRPTPVSRSTS